MKQDLTTWIAAYTLIPRVKTFAGIFKWTTFDIIFEEHAILSVSDAELATRLTSALNGAYNLGRAKQSFDSQF